MPSEFEAYGIALIEALAAGIPCVARNVCAMPEILDGGALGRLSESNDPAEIARLIEDALSDDDLYRRVRTRMPEIRAFYTWNGRRSRCSMTSERTSRRLTADGSMTP